MTALERGHCDTLSTGHRTRLAEAPLEESESVRKKTAYDNITS